MSGSAGEPAGPSARVRRLRARRRLVAGCDRASVGLAASWALIVASGAFPPPLDEAPGCSGWLVGVGVALVMVLAIRRWLDPVTPLREVPLVARVGELAGGRWLASPWLVPSTFLATALFLAAGAIARHHAFATPGGELALFENVLWNTVHGRLGLSSFLGERSFAMGFAPLVAILALPYAVIPRAETLLVIQSLAVAACAFPLARLARREIPNPALAHALVLAQAAYLPMRVVARCDFQPALLAAPLLLTCVASLREGRTRWAIYAWGAALACDPAVAPAALALGVFIGLAQRRPALGAMLGGIALARVVVIVWSAPGTGMADPWLAITSLGHPPGIGAEPVWHPAILVFVVLAPLAFLPLFAPAHALLAAPSLVLAAAGAARVGAGAFAWHVAVAAPLLLVAAIHGARTLAERDDLRGLAAFYPTVAELERYLTALLLIGAGVFLAWSPVAELRVGTAAGRLARETILAELPLDEAVSAQGNLAAHLARRLEVVRFPDRLAPWIVLDGGRWSGSTLGAWERERWSERLRATPGCAVDAQLGEVERFRCGAEALRALAVSRKAGP